LPFLPVFPLTSSSDDDYNKKRLFVVYEEVIEALGVQVFVGHNNSNASGTDKSNDVS
jgi:hypothetical protein